MKKALIAVFVIAVSAYGALGFAAAKQTTSNVQKSLDRMNAVEATLK